MDFGVKGNSELRKIPVDMPKQSSRAIPRKRCSENMRQNTHVEVRFQQNCQATSYFFQFILTITVFYGAAIKIAVYSKCVCCFSIFMSHLAYMSILLSKKKKKKKKELLSWYVQKQPPRGVPTNRRSEDMQENSTGEIYRRNCNSAWVSSCKFTAYFQNTFS